MATLLSLIAPLCLLQSVQYRSPARHRRAADQQQHEGRRRAAQGGAGRQRLAHRGLEFPRQKLGLSLLRFEDRVRLGLEVIQRERHLITICYLGRRSERHIKEMAELITPFSSGPFNEISGGREGGPPKL